MSPRALLTVIAAVFSVLALVGCGLEGQPFDSGDSTTDAPALGDAVVTPDAIAAYPPSSPEATALRWWRAIQTRDPEAVLASYTPEARDAFPKWFEATLVAFLAPSASQSSFVIDYAEPGREGEVTVYAVIAGSPDIRMNGPIALPMTRDDDEWLITDVTFLDALIHMSDATSEEGSK